MVSSEGLKAMRQSFGYGFAGLGEVPRAGYTPSKAAADDYAARNADLARGADPATYWRHFTNYGAAEGRTWDYSKLDPVVLVPAPVVPSPVIAPGDGATLFGMDTTTLLIVAAAAFFLLKGSK